MSSKKTTKSFDCVAWKHKRQAEIYSVIKGMTPQEEIEYFENAAMSGPLGAWWRKVTRQRPDNAVPRSHHKSR